MTTIVTILVHVEDEESFPRAFSTGDPETIDQWVANYWAEHTNNPGNKHVYWEIISAVQVEVKK